MSGEVSVYLRDQDQLLISSYSSVVNGPYVSNGWAQALAVDSTDERLGKAVLEGLDRTEMDVPDITREELAKRLRPLLRLAGVRSFTRFAVGTKAVAVSRDVAEQVAVVPTRNRGRREGGFIEMPEMSIEIKPPCNESSVGRAVREGLARALPS